MTDSLYREEILEHYRSPQHFGRPDTFDRTSHQHNPFCGDDITMFVRFHTDKLTDISFTGQGCAISIAAASLLTDFMIGRSKEELTKFGDEDMLKLLDIPISETRKKCAFLALATLKDCL